MNDEFKMLSAKCRRLNRSLEKQNKGILPYEQWLALVRLFVNAGRINLAREFTNLTEKRDYQRENEIDKLSLDKKSVHVLCTEMGCSEEAVEYCFDNKAKTAYEQERNHGEHDFWVSQIKRNSAGEIINSPASKIALRLQEKKNAGLIYKKNENGVPEFSSTNPNIYAIHLLKNYRLMYHHSSSCYYLYNNHYWQPLSDYETEKLMREFFHKLEPNKWKSGVQSTYMSALSYECRNFEQFESAENYINVENGLLDLSGTKIKRIPHDENIFSTVQIPITHSRKADCPKFKNFLNVTFMNDQKLIDLVQEIMGYCLPNSVKAHKMFIFRGDGSNGKSVLCDIMIALAGGVENVSTVTLENLSEKFALSQIMNKTLNISTENEVSKNLDTQMLKAISSGDIIQIEEKFKKPFSYRPYVKLVFAMNNMPRVGDRLHAFLRRLTIIPFDMRFIDGEPREGENEAKIDRNLADNLINEELSGIFTFAMRGLERLRKNKFSFTESERSQKALEEFKEQQDATLEFVRGFVEMDESAEPVNVTAFWNYYKEWCGREGYINSQKVSQKNFAQATQRVFREEGIPYKKEKAHGGLLHLFRIRVKGMNDTNADALVGLIDDKDDNGKTKSKKTPSPKPRDEIDEFLS